MSYEPDRIELIWRGMLERYPQFRDVLKDDGSMIDAKANPDVAFLRAWDILYDRRKEELFQEELRKTKYQRKSRAVTPQKRAS